MSNLCVCLTRQLCMQHENTFMLEKMIVCDFTLIFFGHIPFTMFNDACIIYYSCVSLGDLGFWPCFCASVFAFECSTMPDFLMSACAVARVCDRLSVTSTPLALCLRACVFVIDVG